MTIAILALLNLHTFAAASAERMLNSVLEGILVALFAWFVVRFVGRQNSNTRFAVWFLALIAIAALPVLTVDVSSVLSGGVASHPALTLPSSWALSLVLVWAVIAAFGLVRVGVGILRLRKLRRSCTPIETASLDVSVLKTLNGFAGKRRVEFFTSDRLSVPAAVGFFRPAVVIPAWSMRELSSEELNSVLLHELAHLRRWDDWTNLAQKVLRAVFFFHPAVWLVESKLSIEREMACDDAVLAATASSPRAYAECLVSLAERSMFHRGLALAQAAVGRVRQTSLRISKILDANRPGTTGVWKPAVGLLAAFSMVVVFSLSEAPQLVAFNSEMPSGFASAASPSDPSALRAINASYKVPAADRVHPQSVTKHDAARKSGVERVAAAPLAPAHRLARSQMLTMAKFEQRSSSSRMVATNALKRTTNVVPTDAVFVVMESQFDHESGSTYWTVSVWHLTVFNSRSSNLDLSTIPAKSI